MRIKIIYKDSNTEKYSSEFISLQRFKTNTTIKHDDCLVSLYIGSVKAIISFSIN